MSKKRLPIFKGTSGLNTKVDPVRLQYGEGGIVPLAEAKAELKLPAPAPIPLVLNAPSSSLSMYNLEPEQRCSTYQVQTILAPTSPTAQIPSTVPRYICKSYMPRLSHEQ